MSSLGQTTLNLVCDKLASLTKLTVHFLVYVPWAVWPLLAINPAVLKDSHLLPG